MNLYHYCSNASFLSIVSTREIWASDFSLSNDHLEGKWIREVFGRYCNDSNVSAIDQLKLLEHFDYFTAFCGGSGFCMSEEADLLSQWRAYADNGAGVSIGFRRDYFEELGNRRRDRNDLFNASLTKVEYDLAEQKKLIAQCTDQILKLVSEGALLNQSLASISLGLTPENEKSERLSKFRQLLIQYVFFILHLFTMKNPAFAEEREWRVISHILPEGTSNLVVPMRAMDFRPLTDRIVPYRRIPLEKLQYPALAEVVLGPRNITPDNVVTAALEKNGFENVKVRRSSSSYR